MNKKKHAVALFILSVPLFISVCADEATVTIPMTVETFTDPFAYCTAVGTIDAPDARYSGPAMPDSVVQAMIAQGIVSADAPAEIQQAAVWRCMDGHVWACAFGANLPCQDKAGTSTTPTTEMNDYCASNPGADFIPAAVTGHATIYAWSCNGSQAVAGEQVWQVDPRGFVANIWYELNAQ